MSEDQENRKTREWGDESEDDVLIYINMDDDAERERLIKKLTKDKVLELTENLRTKYKKDRSYMDDLRQKNHDQHTLIVQLNKDVQQEKQENTTAKTDYTRLENALQDETNKKKTVLNELSDTKNLLAKKETLVTKLKEKLGGLTPCDSAATGTNNDILIIVDPKMLGLIDDLINKDTKLNWDKMIVKSGVKGLLKMLSDEEIRQKVYTYTKVILVLGSLEILAGGDGFKIANELKPICSKLRELEVFIDIMQIPPAPEDRAVELECFNMRIQTYASPEIKIIETENLFQKCSYTEMYQDDKFTAGVLSILAGTFDTVVVPSKIDKKPYQPCTKALSDGDSDSADDDYPFNEEIFIDPAFAGLIIGRSGANIRRLQDETGTKVQLYEDDEAGTKSLLIKAKTDSDLQLVKRKINRQIKNASKTATKRTHDDKKLNVVKKKKM